MTPKTCIGFVDSQGRGVTREHRDARPCGHVLMDPTPEFDTYYCEGCGRDWQRRYVEEACRHCGQSESEHGTRGWCDSELVGDVPGCYSFARRS